jgi:hypothetical protein
MQAQTPLRLLVTAKKRRPQRLICGLLFSDMKRTMQ